MTTVLSYQQAKDRLLEAMDANGMTFTVAGFRRLASMGFDTLVRLYHVLLDEGKYSFIGECEVSDLPIVRS